MQGFSEYKLWKFVKIKNKHTWPNLISYKNLLKYLI